MVVGAKSSSGMVQRWAQANGRSADLHRRACMSLPGGVTHDVRRVDPFPVAVERAEGSRKWTLDGQELIDYVMGHGSLILGHCPQPVVDAVREQAGLFFHPGACTELEVEWAERVIRLVPSAERVRFTSSGTEATLLALRLARAVTGRPTVVKLAGHFHGWHDQMAIGADAPFDEPDSAGLPAAITSTVKVVAPNVQTIAEVLAGREVAALILEPSGAAWGTVPLPEDFLADVRRLTSETGTLLVFDEVISGFRWSPGGVQAAAGVVPDLTALGKILAGGMPGGAVCGRGDILDNLALPGGDRFRVNHPGTHNAHPLAAAAGIATLEAVASGEAQRYADELAASLRREFTAVLRRHGVEGRSYGESSTFHLLLGTEESPTRMSTTTLKQGLSSALSTALHCGMLLEGVHLFHGSGFLSTAHTPDDVEHTIAAFDATVGGMKDEGLL